MTSYTSPTETAENAGKFAFYAEAGKENSYYIYSVDRKKWVSYTKAASYENGTNKAVLESDKSKAQPWNAIVVNDNYQFAPYNNTGVASKYMNWFGGKDQNALDNTNKTVGFWEQGASQDAGSRWILTEVQVYTYTMDLEDGVTVTINGQTYTDGQTVTVTGALSPSDVVASQKEGKFAVVNVDNEKKTVTVTYYDMPALRDSQPYTQAWVYPKQQDAVGTAMSEKEGDVYTLYNNVLAASFLKGEKTIYFLGSKAMNLVAGTELFIVGFGNGEKVAASQMQMKSFEQKDLAANPTAIGGAEHYAGKALEAVFGYTYKGEEIEILWRAVLRDGSHYLRTEMELKGIGNVDMFDIIAMTYNVDAKEAGSKPATIGNTRGKVIMSNKIFAGLETPTAYNTVGGASDDEDKWDLVSTPVTDNVAASAWTKKDINDVPMRIQEVGGSDKTYYTYTKQVELKKNQKVTSTLTYKGGAKRFDIDGVVLLDENGSIVASDYHHGYTGTAKENNTYSFIVPNDGKFSVCMYIDGREGDIVSTAEFKVEVFEAKAGVDVTSDIVNIQGRWSRNTTLAKDETWKVAAVVGLIAQDGEEDNTDIRKTQKRRSFLAYSERERAVPWRAVPAYISWYELQINRNNAAPGREHIDNTKAADVLNVMAQWKTQFYDRYGVSPKMFVIDDGWDLYGEWTFHSSFPNELRDMSKAAKEMGAGIGAWLGPVGGYGQSGNYRRQYWNDKGGMQLSNPRYYAAFKKAAYNLVCNQDGTEGYQAGSDNYVFFKFDGISGQFSSVGPDNGDVGNENAEGIIRLERYVREELREDIFFNTTVGTWASPFWYQISDATWRQENDYDEIGNNSNKRENWITYRDNLVHQNYVTNSPICPINTLMTHGFILTKFGPPAGAPRDYKSVLNELRCAFACGSGLVELYNDYDLMNSINGGQLWKDLADLMQWQNDNADVLMDAHWVGGDPWTGSKAEIYGWAAWNGEKASLTLRNGANTQQSIKITLREAFEIPANINGSIVLTKCFADQANLQGLTEGEAINIDTELTLTLPASSVYMFGGRDSEAAVVAVESISFDKAQYEVEEESSVSIVATVNPTNATNKNLEWSSSDEAVATVTNGLVKGIAPGKATITATAADDSGVMCQAEVTVTEKVIPPYNVNFDKNISRAAANGRALSGIAFTPAKSEAKTLTIESSTKRYLDLTEDEDMILSCAPGEEINVTLKHGGSWMHGYVYIDLDNDQQFSFKEGSTDQSGTDLVSFFFYNGEFGNDGPGVNSLGEAISGNDRNPGGNIACPKFTAPKEGTYRIRFKTDWNSVDAGGQIAADGTCTGANGILANSGTIVDATLEVVDATGIGELKGENGKAKTEIYDLSGRKANASQHGVFIQNGKKVVR
ncbi:MAG: Ig-like domain-containing protein [Bacteroidaceae bacterium]|nr:Ig-like domain-containing protein [Bacteroidaceae bacterium]